MRVKHKIILYTRQLRADILFAASVEIIDENSRRDNIQKSGKNKVLLHEQVC